MPGWTWAGAGPALVLGVLPLRRLPILWLLRRPLHLGRPDALVVHGGTSSPGRVLYTRASSSDAAGNDTRSRA